MAKRKAGGGVQLDLIGDEAVQRKFKALEGKLQKKFARKSMRKAAKVIQKEAKARVPTGKTGMLKKNIKVRSAKRSRSRIGINVVVGEGWYTGEQFYGAFVELGTSKQPARPFMRPALEDKRDEARRVLVDELQDLIQKEAVKA